MANNFTNLAADLLLASKAGRLTDVVARKCEAQPIEVTGQGIRRVNIDRFYDRVSYRPNVTGLIGLPMFLH